MDLCMKEKVSKCVVKMFTLLALLAVFANATQPVVAAVNDLPVSCWSFDETVGNAIDAIGANTLQNQNSMPYTAGKVGGAADIDDHNSVTEAQYLSIDDTAQQGLQMTDAISGSVWINYDESMDNKYSMIFSKFDDTNYTSNDISYAVAFNGANHQLQFWASRDGDTNSDIQPSIAPVAVWAFNPVPGVWYHIAVTYKAGNVHLYIDTKEQKIIYNYTDISIHQSAAPFTVGYTSVIREAHQKVDELGIWNRVLTKNEVKKLYNNGNGISCQTLKSIVQIDRTGA